MVVFISCKVVDETELWYMDLGRCIIPKPKWRFMIGKGLYYYFLKDSINGKLFGLFTEGKYRCNDRSGIEVPIMIFEHDRERKSFEEWFLSVDRELNKIYDQRLKKMRLCNILLEKKSGMGNQS